MSRFTTLDPKQATGKAKDLLDAVQSKLGITPNMTRIMANSPAVLAGYLAFGAALSEGSLDAKTREQLALAVAESNDCDYCRSAHSAIGKMTGLTAEQIQGSRVFTGTNAKADAALKFAKEVLATRGAVSDAVVETARKAGLTDGELGEVIGAIALNIFTNYFNRAAQTEIDFPVAPKLAKTA